MCSGGLEQEQLPWQHKDSRRAHVLGTSGVIINVMGRYGDGMSRLSKTIRTEN